MAITGLILIFFLLAHMYGNLKMFSGPDAFDHYAHWLKSDILYPIVPVGAFIWIFRAFLIVCIVLHMYAAWKLTVRDRAARGPDHYVATKRLAQTYSARTMRWGGVILVLFLIFHLLQFTVQAVTPGFTRGTSPFEMFVATFSAPVGFLMVPLYALWLVAVCMHVRHGVWSSLTTLGANTSPRSRSVLNAIAWIVAVLLFVGFLIAPLAVFFGWVR